MADSVDQFLDIIDNRIEKHLNNNNCGYLRQRAAVVTEYDEDSMKAFVYFVDDENKTQYTFYNKTSEILLSGDNVKIYYTSNSAKGWIGERCGMPSVKKNEVIIPYVSAKIQNQSAIKYNRIEQGLLSIDFSVDDNKSDVVFLANQMCNVSASGDLTAVYKVDGATQEFKLVENMDTGKKVMTHVYPMSLGVGKHNLSVYLLSENGGGGNIPAGSLLGTLSGQISGIKNDAPANDNIVFYYTGVPAETNIVLPPYIINDTNAKKYVDWGDNTAIEESVASYTVNHTYAEAGDYIITIKSDSVIIGGNLNSKIADTNSGSSNYLTRIYLPDNATTVRFSTAVSCPNLETLHFGKNTLNITWKFGSNKITSLLIPDRVTYAWFEELNKTNITSLRIPENVSTIPSSMFLPSSCKVLEHYGSASTTYSSSGLVTLRVGGNATSTNSLYRCETLKNIEFVNASKITSFGSFSNCTGLVDVELVASIKTIIQRAFYQCTNLKSVKNLSGVTTIETSAFGLCSALEEIELPNVQTIAIGAFTYCSALTRVSFPKVQTIGDSAFESCTSLTEIELPDTTYYLGNRAFAVARNLTKVIIPKSVKTIGREAFYATGLTRVKIAKDCTVYSNAFPNGCVIEYYD